MNTALYEAVLQVDPAPIVLCDLAHTIVYMNPAAVTAYANRGGIKLLGQSLLACHSPASCRAICAVVDAFLLNDRLSRVFTYHYARTNSDVYMMALRDADGRLIGYYEKHESRAKEVAPSYSFEDSEGYELRRGSMADLEALAKVEQECFPLEEAANRVQFEQRLVHYSNHFLLLFKHGELISFIDGFVTDCADLTDEMYDNAALHNESGAWQMVFGVNTLPLHRRQGNASRLMRTFIGIARREGRKGIVLTCKQEKIHWYESFGFVNEGESSSVHGGIKWFQMRLTF